MRLKTLKDITDLKDKKVLLRVDTDVEIEDGKILDDTRLKASLPTINFLLEKQAKIILIGHLGRPEGRIVPSLSLKPIAEWYEKNFKTSLKEINLSNFKGWEILPKLILLENIRFFKGEEKNDRDFAKELSKLGKIYVNDAFAVCHRKQASIFEITKFLPAFAGLHLSQEIEVLSRVMKNPERPLVVLIGGAKIETKLPLVEKMHQVADYVLVGGEIAEQDKTLMKIQHEELVNKKSILLVADSKENKKDITEKSVENFEQIINVGKTIIWNGTMGEINKDAVNEEGTRKIAETVASLNGYKVVGGGDTVAFLRKTKLLDKFDFVSTGGGAMLEFLSGEKLPGIEPLLE